MFNDDPFKAESSDSLYDDAKENIDDMKFESAAATDTSGNLEDLCTMNF